jgi:hypothetical protein
MPELNIPPSLSYRPADRAEPVLDISIGDALRAATSTWPTRKALIDGTELRRSRRVADGRSRSCSRNRRGSRGHCCSVSFQANTLRSGRPMARNG